MADEKIPQPKTEGQRLKEQREYMRQYREANRDKVRAQEQARKDADPEAFLASARKRTAKWKAKYRAAHPLPPEPTPLERFQKNYIVDEKTGCWLWTGQTTFKGYSVMKIKQQANMMHRWAYANFVGPIPDGFTIDHTCHNQSTDCAGGNTCLHRRCVNPAHLEAVSALANTQRGREHYWKNADITRPSECPNGHPYEGDNVIYSGKDGRYRSCRICRNERQMAKYHERRAPI